MLFRTHYALIILVLLLFIPHVENQFLFIGAALIATLIVDIDVPFSKLGQMRIFRFLQFFVKHRGMLHSLTVALVISVLVAIFWPVVAFGFFLGYSVHIFADSFTRDGVEPFWPWKASTKGWLKVGGYSETVFFVFLVLADILTLIFVYFI